MSVLGDTIRNNADLHKAVYRILADLAAAHMTGKNIGRPHFDYLCALAASAVPHFPAPASAAGAENP